MKQIKLPPGVISLQLSSPVEHKAPLLDDALYLETKDSPDRGPAAAQPIAVSQPKSALCWSHAGSDHSHTHPFLSCPPLSLYCKARIKEEEDS